MRASIENLVPRKRPHGHLRRRTETREGHSKCRRMNIRVMAILVCITALSMMQMSILSNVSMDKTTTPFDLAESLPQMEETQLSRHVHRLTNATTIDRKPTYRGRVFYCGYKIDLAEHIFPEYKFVTDSEWKESLSKKTKGSDSHENDILVVGLWGPGCNRGKGDERTKFRGKILYVNGEPDGDPVLAAWDNNKNSAQKIYQIGPYPEPIREDLLTRSNRSRFYERHSLHIYHTAMTAMRIYLSTEENVMNPWKQLVEGSSNERSISELDRRRIPAIVYVSRNCVSFRQEAAELLARHFQDRATVVSIENEDNHGNKQTRRRLEMLRRLSTSDFSENKKLLRDEKRMNSRLSLLERTPRDNKMLDKSQNIDNSELNNELSSSFLHYGGECQVKGGIPLPPVAMEGFGGIDRSQFHSNYKTIYTRYKYCLVMENTKKDGYVTEKLLHALLGGCLPIYYGSKDVYKIFREDSFIYFDVENPESALSQIEMIEANHTEYLRRTNRQLPLLKSSSPGDPFSTAKTVDEYFSILPNIGSGMLCRKIHEMMGLSIPESVANKMGKVDTV